MSKITPTEKMSPMLRAFVEQSDLDDSAVLQRDAILQEWQNEQYKKALAQITKSGDIFQTAMENDESGPHDKSEIHPQFRNYDHSLEMDRVEKSGVTKEGKPIFDDHDSMRPVEKDGKIEFESTLTMDELLERS